MLDQLAPALFVLAFPALWCSVTWATAKFSGWARLAGHYPALNSGTGVRFRFQSAQFRGMANYGGCLVFGVRSSGLYLATIAVFRPGHPPLLIPWNEITAWHVAPRWHDFGFRKTRLSFRRAPEITVDIARRLFEKLAAAGAPLLCEPTER